MACAKMATFSRAVFMFEAAGTEQSATTAIWLKKAAQLRKLKSVVFAIQVSRTFNYTTSLRKADSMAP